MNEHMGACAHGRKGAPHDRVRACANEHMGAWARGRMGMGVGASSHDAWREYQPQKILTAFGMLNDVAAETLAHAITRSRNALMRSHAMHSCAHTPVRAHEPMRSCAKARVLIHARAHAPMRSCAHAAMRSRDHVMHSCASRRPSVHACKRGKAVQSVTYWLFFEKVI
jgi:hypothetical protein